MQWDSQETKRTETWQDSSKISNGWISSKVSLFGTDFPLCIFLDSVSVLSPTALGAECAKSATKPNQTKTPKSQRPGSDWLKLCVKSTPVIFWIWTSPVVQQGCQHRGLQQNNTGLTNEKVESNSTGCHLARCCSAQSHTFEPKFLVAYFVMWAVYFYCSPHVCSALESDKPLNTFICYSN